MILLFADDFTTGASTSGLYSRTSTSGHSWVVPSAEQGGAIVNVPPITGLNSSGYSWGVTPTAGETISAEVPSVMADVSQPIKMEFDIFNDGGQIYFSSWYVAFAIRVAMGFIGSPLYATAISFETFNVDVALTNSDYITQLGKNPNADENTNAPMVRTTVTIEWDGLSGLTLKLNGTAITTEVYTPDTPFITPKITADYDDQSGIIMENFRLYGTPYSTEIPSFWKDRIKCREVL